MARITHVSQFLGPSLYGRLPVIRATIAWDLPDKRYTPAPPAVIDALVQVLPGLAVPGETDNGFDMARLILAVAVQIQFLSNADTEYHAVVDDELGVHLVCSYENHNVHAHAVRIALDLVTQFLSATVVTDQMVQQATAACEEFYRQASHVNWTLDYRFIVREARHLGIPIQHLMHYCMVLGQGKYRRFLLGKHSDRTSYFATRICGDKSLCAQTLAQVGLPVPSQRVVNSEQEAVDAARALGYPVVVKPLSGTGGAGVTTGIPDEKSVVRAFRRARDGGSNPIVVETMLEGDQHRFTIINRTLVAIYQQTKPFVVGDGRRTIGELVEEENRNPRRMRGQTGDLFPLVLDEEAYDTLRNAGYDMNSVPLEGKTVTLSSVSNTHSGGSYEDVFDKGAHPDNLAAAILAVDAVGLDIAGVDFILPDVTRSWKGARGGICEVNATPGIWANPRAVDPLFSYLFPPGATVRIPTAVVMGAKGDDTVARMLAHVVGKAGSNAGLAFAAGCFAGAQLIREGDCSNADCVQQLFRHPHVETAVIQTTRPRVLEEGLGFDHCHVAAIMDVSEERSGRDGIGTSAVGDIEGLLSGLADKVVVLNGDDPRCGDLAKTVESATVCYVSSEPASDPMAAHMAAGGAAVVLEQEGSDTWIVIHEGDQPERLLRSKELSFGDNEEILRSSLFVIATARALGIEKEVIVSALTDYRSDSSPGSSSAQVLSF